MKKTRKKRAHGAALFVERVGEMSVFALSFPVARQKKEVCRLFVKRAFPTAKKITSLLLLLAFFFPLWPPAIALAAGTPSIISYQGRLADVSGNLLGGSGTTYYFKFSIWDNSTVGSGSRLWPIAEAATTTAVVREGVFNVNIGDTAAGYPDVLDYDFSRNANIYLQVEVSSDNLSSQTLTPRLRIASNAFAQLAGAVSGSTTPSSFGTTTPITNSVVTIEATSSGSIPLSIRANASQTANLFQIQNALGSALFLVNGSGGLQVSSLNTAGCTIKADTGGNFFCGTDAGAGGTSEINWTWFNNSGIRVATSTNQVLIGANATTSLSQLEVSGDVRAFYFTATTTSINTFPQLAFVNASGTSLFVSASSTIQILNSASSTITELHTTNATFAIAPTFPSLTSSGLGVNSVGGVYAAATTTFSTGLTYTNGGVVCDTGSNTVFGCLSAADWSTFFNRAATTSLNSWSQLQTFTNGFISLASSTIQDLNSASSTISVGSIGQLSFINATGTSIYTSASSTLQNFNSASSTIGIALVTAATATDFYASRMKAGTFDLTNALAITNGGTGLASITGNRMLYTNSGGTAFLEVATSSLSIGGTAGNVTGIVAAANGGTGASTLTGLLQGNGASAITGITGTAGQFPYYNGASTLAATSSIFLATSGNVGIGDATPDGVLDFDQSSTNTTADTTYGGNFTITDTGVVTTGTDTTYGTYISLTRTGATGGTLNTYGTYVDVLGDNAGAGTHNIYGGYFSAYRGDINIGVLAKARAPSAATSNTAVEANTWNDSSVTDTYGVHVTYDVAGFGTGANVYGLYLDDAINATNDYGVYQAGSNDDNYFAGNVGIGTTSPYAPLSVLGQVVASFFTATTTTASTFPQLSFTNATGTSIYASGSSTLQYFLSASSTLGTLLVTGNATATNLYLSGQLVAGGATSTFSGGGVNLTNGGCFAIGGTCVTSSATGAQGGTGAVQFANGTSFNGDNATFFWDNTAKALTIGTSTTYAKLGVQGVFGNFQPLFDIASTTGANGSATSSVFNVAATGLVTIPGTFIVNGSSTLQNLNSGSTTLGTVLLTSATATDFFATRAKAGTLSLTNALANLYGGTGQNSSAWSGGVGVNAGTWYQAATTTFSTGITYANGAVTCDTATSLVFGCLATGDWSAFNNKVSSTSLSGASVISYTSSTGVITTQGGAFGAGNYSFPSDVTIGTTSPWAKLAIQDTFGSRLPLFDIASTTGANGSATSSVFTVLANGNVGIASTTPYAPLSVLGQVVASFFTATTTTASTFPQLAFTNATGTSLYTSASSTIQNLFSTTVGIASTSPGSLLSVGGTGTGINFTLATSTWNTTGGLNLTNGCFAIGGTCLSTGGSTSAAGGTGAVQFANGTSFAGDNATFFWDNTAKALTIGTTTTYAKLGVQGVFGNFQPLFDIASTTGANGSATSSVFTVLANGNVGIGTTTPWGKLSVTQTGTGGAPAFIVEDSASPDTTPFIIDQTGNVGIGTTSPFAQLSVVGASGNGNAINAIAVYGGTTVNGNGGGMIFVGGKGDDSGIGGSFTVTGGTGGGAGVGGAISLTGGTGGGGGNKVGGDVTLNGGVGGGTAQAGNVILANSQGKVGIASSTPWATLSVSGVAGVTNPIVDVASSTNLSYFRVNYDGVVTASQLAFTNATGTSLYTSASSTIQNLFSTTVGIASTSPGSLLSVGGTGTGINFTIATSTWNTTGGLNLTNGCFAIGGTCVGGSSGSGTVGASTAIGQFPYYAAIGTTLTATSSIFLATSGYIGIGTTSPYAILSISNSVSTPVNTTLFAIASTTAGTATTTLFSVDSTGLVTLGDSSGTGDANFQFASDSNAWNMGYNSTDKSFNIASSTSFSSNVAFTILKNNLNVGIGTTTPYAKLSLVDNNGTSLRDVFAISTSTSGLIFKVDSYGQTFADGAYTGTGADYAEYFYTNSADLKSGETVCVDILENNAVKRCERGADNNVMGIVSTKPSVIGNYIQAAKENPSHYAIIGMLGQVEAYVSAENGTINVGDSLTSASSTPGYTMRADGGDSTVAIALEPLSEGTGKIKVLISRRNKSLAVEEVEALVVERIANMKIEDSVQLMIKTSVDNLNLDPKITEIAQDETGKLSALLTVGINDNTSAIAKLNENFTNLNANSARIFGAVTIDDSGNIVIGLPVEIGTTSPWRALSVRGKVNFDGLTESFGVGALCLTGDKEVVWNGGADSCRSALSGTKHDINTLAVGSIDILNRLQPVSFVYNVDASSTLRYGFNADDLAETDAHLVTYDAKGMVNGIDDQAMMAIFTQALQEIDLNLETIASTTASSTPASNSFASSFWSNAFTKITQWFADTTNGIGDFFANRVRAKELCVSDDSGETCITKGELDALLAGAGMSAPSSSSTQTSSGSLGGQGSTTPTTGDSSDSTSAASSSPTGGDPRGESSALGGLSSGGTGTTTPPAGISSSTPPALQVDTTTPVVSDVEPPVVTLTGDASMTITVGDTWSDPGATAIDNVYPVVPPGVDTIGVDGDLTAKIVVTGSVDTALVGSYTLTYVVSDTAGNQGTTTRTVEVLAGPVMIEEVTPVPSTDGVTEKVSSSQTVAPSDAATATATP